MTLEKRIKDAAELNLPVPEPVLSTLEERFDEFQLNFFTNKQAWLIFINSEIQRALEEVVPEERKIDGGDVNIIFSDGYNACRSEILKNINSLKI
jgi:hypothetical protein